MTSIALPAGAAVDYTIASLSCSLPPVVGYLRSGPDVTTPCAVVVGRVGFDLLHGPPTVQIRVGSYEVQGGVPTTLVSTRVVDTFVTNEVGVPIPRVVTLTEKEDLTGADMGAWLALQAQQGRVLVLAAVVDATDRIPETNEANNAKTMAPLGTSFQLAPLTGALYFGAARTVLKAGTVVEAGAACAGADYELSLKAKAAWAAGGGFGLVRLDPGGLCVDVKGVTVRGLVLEAAAMGAVVEASATGVLGGLPAVVDVSLSPSGVVVSALSVALPDGHSFHWEKLGVPSPAGVSTVSFPDITLPNPGSLAGLHATRTGGWLHATRLPFLLHIDQLDVTQKAVSGTHAGPRWVHQRAFLEGDPRSPTILGIARVLSNDIRWSNGAIVQRDRRFSVGTGGLAAKVTFGIGKGGTHFPKAEVAWLPSTVTVTRGALANQTLRADVAQSFVQSADCAACSGDPAGDVSFQVVPTGPMGLSSGGAVIAQVSGLSNPAFGPYDPALGHVFARSGDTEKTGVMSFPGHVAAGTADGASVPSYLLGARAVKSVGGVLRPAGLNLLEDPETQRGNHFVAGLTVGPEQYDVDGAPSEGGGQVLAGDTATEVRLGGLDQPGACAGGPCPLPSNEATRYVVRAGGVTGVFDTDTPPTPTVYGYQLPLTRFAFRVVRNIVDPASGIEGAVTVPPPGDFTLAFDSLAITCTGGVGDALVVPCPEGGGPGDPNCGLSLGAWKTPMTPLTLGFAPEAGASSCSPGDRGLEVGSTLVVHALSDPLGLTARWSPAGEPSEERVTGPTAHILDADAAGGVDGFPVALHPNPRLEWAAPDDGWYAFSVDYALPFFDALTADVRLANATLAARAETFAQKPGADWWVDGACTRSAFPDNDAALAACAPAAHYRWGATGFDLDLQAFYDGATARFTGITKEHGLAVMSLRAAIESISPDATAVRFGASAELEDLALAEIDLNIDLDDPAAVEATDAFLATVGVGGHPIGSMVGEVQGAVGGVLDAFGADLDLQLRDVVRASIDAASAAIPGLPPGETGLDVAVDTIHAVRGLPATFAAEASLALGDARAALLAGLTAELDAEAIALLHAYASIFASVELAPCAVDPLLPCDEALARLAELRAEVAAVRASLGTLSDKVTDAEATVTGLVIDAKALLTGATALVTDVRDAVFVADPTISAFVEGDVTSNELLGLLLYALAPKLRGAMEKLEGVEVVSNLSKLTSLVPLPAAAGEVQSDIRERATELIEDFDQNVASFELTIEAGDFSGALDGATGFLDDLQAALVSVEGALGALEGELGAPFDALRVAIDESDRQLAAIDSVLASLEEDIRCAMDASCGGVELSGLVEVAIEAELNARFSAATGGALELVVEIGGAEQGFVLQLVDVLGAPIDTALADIALAVELELDPIFDLPDVATAAELRDLLADLVMNAPAIEAMILTFQRHFDLLVAELSGLSTELFAQVEAVLADLSTALGDVSSKVLAAANGVIDDLTADLPITAASLSGLAVIAGNELSKLHIGASWTMTGSEDGDSRTFDAGLDVTPVSTNGEGDACASGSGAALLDAVISTRNMPLRIGPSQVTIESLELGFTLDGSSGVPSVVGLFGGITTDGGIDFDALRIYDIAFAAGAGEYESYVGAKASASFSAVQLSVGFLVGRTCSLDVLESLDPQVAKFISVSPSGFSGAYVRGSAGMPIIDLGCLLNLSLTADVGSWLVAGPPSTVGGLVGGGAYGKLGCISALRGQATAFLQKSGDKVKFKGEGFGVAGLGIDCDPETWTSVSRSRKDDKCGTGDARLSITYDDGHWKVPSPKVSAVH